MHVSGPLLATSYDYQLVALSVFIAILASYAALDMAARITLSSGGLRWMRLGGGAVAFGTGIWSMHYIGMLALRLPVPIKYDWPTLLLSFVAAILASGVALFVVSRREMKLPKLRPEAWRWARELQPCTTLAWPRCEFLPFANTPVILFSSLFFLRF